jgi:hypothetical protein
MFSTSLYEIDWLLDEQKEAPTEAPPILTAYTEFKDIFLKEALDILLLHRTYDHKITLD